jgi:hypothetical protein
MKFVLFVKVGQKRNYWCMEHIPMKEEFHKGIDEMNSNDYDTERRNTCGDLHIPDFWGDEPHKPKEYNERKRYNTDKEQKGKRFGFALVMF